MNKILEDILKDFISVRSFITLGAFITIYSLVIIGKINADIVVRIADTLLGFWFGSKVASAIKNGGEK